MTGERFLYQINGLVDDIIADGDKYEVSWDEYPDKEEIITILKNLQKIMFPKHFRNGEHKLHAIRTNIMTLLENVAYNLTEQVAIVLRRAGKVEGEIPGQLMRTAEKIVVEFCKSIPVIRSYVTSDLEAAFAGDPAAADFDEIIFSYPGLYAVMINRIAHELYKLSVPLIPRIMTEYAHSMTGIDIHPGAVIGKSFFIDHGTGVVIGETTVIGDNVKVYQGVTLGAISTKGGQAFKNIKRHPTIGDNVTIYANASILGGNTVIGSGAVIGANAFITSSIPEGARVRMQMPCCQNNS